MSDRDDEARLRKPRVEGWPLPGELRTDSLFWTSPQIRSLPPLRLPGRRYRADHEPGDPRPGGDLPQAS